jgi:hypothetical protein
MSSGNPMPGESGPAPAALTRPRRRKATGEDVRDWRGINAVIGDRAFYVTTDGARRPEIHEAWVEDVDEARILVRSAASSTGPVTGNGRETCWLKEPEDFVIVKGPGFI